MLHIRNGFNMTLYKFNIFDVMLHKNLTFQKTGTQI